MISVSVIPLFPEQGWMADQAQSGAYTCNCGGYMLRFNGPSFGGDKPHVYSYYDGFQVDLIELSDKESTVDGMNVSSAFVAKTSASGRDLVVSYTSTSLNFTKIVQASNGAVNMTYTFTKDVPAQLTFWRWYYATVGTYDRPVSRNLTLGNQIGFTFLNQGTVFNASLSVSPSPVQAQISGVEGGGLNKIVLAFNANRVDLTVKLTAVKPLAGAGVVGVAYSDYAYPIIGVSLAAVYLIIRRNIRSNRRFKSTRDV